MEKQKIEKLIFIYNANSGKHNALLDTMHKIVSPNTYNCNLCDITFGLFTENKTWRKFRETSKVEMVFLHKDEYLKKYKSKFNYKFTFPIVLAEHLESLSVFINTDELNKLKNQEGLMKEIRKRW
ncbi:GTPase [Cellulophaga tyrosinoxydans]|uniref:GTPase n=1 Tax=Cellulophaga tyrosinoxydans TaxID=504486 RepID=A0A1W1Y9G2_9FLAO|nr:GTPase [Cellulophaga tyrosinoxydans]SMC32797.1 hypothetical protein SAMN05660703_0180 [Cellulophaga tyrosinoxydans]